MKNRITRTNTAVHIHLNHGHTAIIDADQYDHVNALPGTWSAQITKHAVYAVMSHNQRTLYLHRYLLGLQPGDKSHVDHLDCNGLNNRLVNIRRVDPTTNQTRKRVCRRMDYLPRNIYRLAEDRYRVSVSQHGRHFQEYVRTLDQALTLRDVVRTVWDMPPAHTLPHPYNETAAITQ